jgi:hypothetical protein
MEQTNDMILGKAVEISYMKPDIASIAIREQYRSFDDDEELIPEEMDTSEQEEQEEFEFEEPEADESESPDYQLNFGDYERYNFGMQGDLIPKDIKYLMRILLENILGLKETAKNYYNRLYMIYNKYRNNTDFKQTNIVIATFIYFKETDNISTLRDHIIKLIKNSKKAVPKIKKSQIDTKEIGTLLEQISQEENNGVLQITMQGKGKTATKIGDIMIVKRYGKKITYEPVHTSEEFKQIVKDKNLPELMKELYNLTKYATFENNPFVKLDNYSEYLKRSEVVNNFFQFGFDTKEQKQLPIVQAYKLKLSEFKELLEKSKEKQYKNNLEKYRQDNAEQLQQMYQDLKELEAEARTLYIQAQEANDFMNIQNYDILLEYIAMHGTDSQNISIFFNTVMNEDKLVSIDELF